MADPEHLAILDKTAEQWNAWRKDNPRIPIDLSHADLSERKFYRINFREANLSGANFDRASLIHVEAAGANFSRASLRGANLSRSNLQGAVFFKANLRSALVFASNLTQANLRAAELSGASFSEADLSDAVIQKANLTKASLVMTNMTGANIIDCRIFGISSWDTQLDDSHQGNLIITPPGQAMITVDNLEVAQFIYLLLHNEKIRGLIDTVARKVVLILGRFTSERKLILDAIREELRRRNYSPVMFDFDKPTSRDLTETVSILAHLSRFVIADLTDPSSIPLELQAIIPELAVPVQPLLLSTCSEFSMMVDLRKKYPWVLATLKYRDLDDLLARFANNVIGPAEAKAKELEKR